MWPAESVWQQTVYTDHPLHLTLNAKSKVSHCGAGIRLPYASRGPGTTRQAQCQGDEVHGKYNRARKQPQTKVNREPACGNTWPRAWQRDM